MEKSWYSFDVSPGWVFLALIAAFGLSLLLYTKKGIPWSKTANVLMGFFRFSAIFMILLLLLNPLLKFNVNEVEKPAVIFALDNSESIIIRSGESVDSIKYWLKELRENLDEKYETGLFTLSKAENDTLKFDARTTNLNELLNSIENVYDGRNVGAVVLISDGIINQGQSPEHQNFSFPVFTLGLGDTIPPKDIVITTIRHNRVAYQGNQFPVNIFLNQKGYENEQVSLAIKEGNKVLKKQNITLKDRTPNLQFLLEATEPGLKRLTVTVENKAGESSYTNNLRDIYVDVVEGKEKVLIIAPAPHPDINAIRSVLHEAANYETILYIPGIQEPPVSKEFDVVITHQAFGGQRVPEYSAAGMWYILGAASSYTRMTQELRFITVLPKGRQHDRVRPVYNSNFSKFKISDELIPRLRNYPPLEVPFGEYTISGPVETLLLQQIGTITTDRPLMTFFDDGTNKSAVLLGAGIWQWRLQEAGSEDNPSMFREIVLKTIQFLSVKAGKDRFVVIPRKTEYLAGDRVFLDTEVYNDIYERSYGNTIRLTLANETGELNEYQMVDDLANSSFNLGAIPAGAYQYEANTTLGGKTFMEKGAFAVRDVHLESIELTANHNLLRAVSVNNGGRFYDFSQRDELSEKLETVNMEKIVRTNEEYFPLINSAWIILLIALCLSTEWFMRKYLGAY